MEKNHVTSSNIEAAGYDDDTRTLRIWFHSGSTWDYAGVPEELYRQFMSSASKGGFFARQIKGRYQATRVT